MTNEMRAFMREMADVMERHGVTEMNIVEKSHNWETVTTGIEFTIEQVWDEDGNVVREDCFHTVHTWMQPDDFREEADA